MVALHSAVREGVAADLQHYSTAVVGYGDRAAGQKNSRSDGNL